MKKFLLIMLALITPIISFSAYDPNVQFPLITSSSFVPFVQNYIDSAINSVPIDRTNKVYFSAAGSDTLGNGTINNPYKTISKLNQLLAFNPTDTMFCLRNGDTFNPTTAITVTSAHNTITNYADINTVFESRPRLSYFTLLQYNQWSQYATGTFVASVTPEVSWVRYQNDNQTIFNHVGSVAECVSKQGTFYYDLGTHSLYVHNFGDKSLTNTQQRIQYVPKNQLEGIIIQDADDVRIHNVIIEGFGAGTPGDLSYPGYGIDPRVSGTMRTVITNCDIFYSGRHNITKGTGSGSSGGSLVVANCSFGATINDGINVVSYAGGGGQELIAYKNKYYSCNLPSPLRPNLYGGGFGAPNLAHTGGGAGQYVAVFICKDNEIVPGQNQPSLMSNCSNLATVNDISQYRAFVIGEKALARRQTAYDQTAPTTNGLINYGLGATNNAFINCIVECRTMWCTYGANYPLVNSSAGLWLNSKITFDWSYAGSPYQWTSNIYGAGNWQSNPVTQLTSSFYFCDFEFIIPGDTGTVGFCGSLIKSDAPTTYNNPAYYWRGKMQGCKIKCKKLTNGLFLVGFANDGVSMLGNVYPEGATLSGNYGFSNDAWAISTGSLGVNDPILPGQIFIDGHAVEYDMDGKLRGVNPNPGSEQTSGN